MPTTTHFDPAFTASAFQGRTNAAGGAVTDVDGPELRLPWSAFTDGVLGAGSYAVTAAGGMVVNVGSGAAFDSLAVVDGATAAQGKYGLLLEPTTQAITISAADLSNPRVDEIYLVVYDDPGTLVLGRIGYRRGDPAASPANPGPDAAWDGSLLLARVAVAAGASSISQGNITDMRPAAALVNSPGTTLPSADILYDLGSSTLSWRRAYLQNLFDEGGVDRVDLSVPLLIGTWDVSGHLRPEATGTRDLGETARRWRAGYISQIIGGGGSPSAPVYGTSQGSNDGIYFPGPGNMQFTLGGVARFGVTTSQVQAPLIHDSTTGAGANLHIESTGSNAIKRSTSALRYKSKVKKAPALADIEVIPTKHYRKDDKQFRYGLIADWLADQDKLLGVYDEDGEIENFDDRAVMAVFAAKHLRTQEQLEQMQERLDQMQAQLDQLLKTDG